MTSQISDLTNLGWSTFFDSQLEPDDLVTTVPVRVMAVHRGGLNVAGPGVDRLIPSFIVTAGDEEAAATVGDWLLLNRETSRPRRLLRRKSLFKRRAAGTGRKLQLIAANVDTLFIGVHGMGEQAGFTTPNILESDTNRAFIRAAGRKVVLADHSKWGVTGLSSFAALSDVDTLITDHLLSSDAIDILGAHIPDVRQVGQPI